jgi:hypothetical protein|tara:strand:- start:415 stop:666 length:252 start_codon:yes stop_codon:yes gene_type:complete
MRREEILSTAAELINGDRDRDYGDAHKNFQDVARLWSVILETEITEQQFVLCMIMLKAARLMKTDHEDSWVDLCGYAALGGEK